MSSRNMFIVKRDNIEKPLGLCEISTILVKNAIANNFAIHFSPTDYNDELIDLLDVKWGEYFCVSDNFYHMETDQLFCLNDCYEEVKHLSKKESEIKEEELLLKKYAFLNEIIEVIFNQANIKTVYFYISTTGTASLGEYQTIKLKDENLTKAFIKMLLPTKIENYFGLKTVKFEINRQQTYKSVICDSSIFKQN